MRNRILLVAFMCIFSAVLFAAPPEPSLWAKGVISLYDQDGKVSTGPDWQGKGTYNELGLAWSGKSAGWSALGMYGADGGASFYLDSFKFYYKFLNDALKLTFGKPRIDDYRIGSYVDDVGYGSRLFRGEYGFFAQAYPVPGLSLAGGFQVPLETTDADDVYERFRVAAAYTVESVGVFNVGYLNDVDRQFFASTSLRFFDPVRVLLGYKGYFDGSCIHYAYASGKAPLGALNWYWDLLNRFDFSVGSAEPYRYEITTLLVYSRPEFSVGSSLWWASQYRKLGCTPYFSAKVPNGYVRLGYRWAYAFDGDKLTWSVPLTYELSF